MRCKKHYTDISSTIGVCSCCLRERLLSVIASQQQQSQSQSQSQPLQNLTGKRYNSDNIPANHRRKRNQSVGAVSYSDNSDPRHRRIISDQLFYKTPEVETASGGNGNRNGNGNGNGNRNSKRSFFRFFSFKNVFRSKNRKAVDSVMVTVTDARVLDSTGRRCAFGDRGMSPVRNSGARDEDESNNATSEYESTESWKNTPRRTPARVGGHVRHLSGLAFCLSPLVRASPNRPEVVFSGEIRAPVKPHLSNAKSFHANRSRKLADFGRTNLNR